MGEFASLWGDPAPQHTGVWEKESLQVVCKTMLTPERNRARLAKLKIERENIVYFAKRQEGAPNAERPKVFMAAHNGWNENTQDIKSNRYHGQRFLSAQRMSRAVFQAVCTLE